MFRVMLGILGIAALVVAFSGCNIESGDGKEILVSDADTDSDT